MVKNLFVNALATCVLSTSLWAADPMVGTWKLNKGKSKFEAGPAPQSQTIKVSQSGEDLRVVMETISSEGKPMTVSYTVRKDGKDYPITGSPVVDTVNWTRVDERTTDMIGKKDGKEVSQIHLVVEPNGKTETVTGTGTNPKGEKYKINSVYDKR